MNNKIMEHNNIIDSVIEMYVIGDNDADGASQPIMSGNLIIKTRTGKTYEIGVRSSFTPVSEQEPPHNIELLAKSPSGSIRLCSWRPAYNIFTCQDKNESSSDWEWKLI